VAAAQAHGLADTYDTSDLDIKIYTIGATYDPGAWFAMAEYVHFAGDGFLQDADAGYVTFGYRIDKFTPYVTYAQSDTDLDDPAVIDTTGMPAVLAGGANVLAGGLNTSLSGFANSQKSYSVGVRWDFSRSADLKIQYDRLTLEDGTAGRLGNKAADFNPQDGDNVDVFSAAIDFVF
jgi:predicted porin